MKESNAYQDYDVLRFQNYTRQQKALNDIARELGVVAFRPDYHGKRGDKNTVLFYTGEAHLHNKKVDRLVARMDCRAYSRAEAADRPYAISDDQVYDDYFFAFENTDVNGNLSYDFANRGALDLRPLNEREVLKNAINKALEAHRMQTAKAAPAEDHGPRMYLVLLANNIDVNIEARPAVTLEEARDLLVSAFLEDLAGREITLGEDGFPPLPDDVFEYECEHDGCELSLSEDGFSVYGDGDLYYGKLVSLPGTYKP